MGKQKIAPLYIELLILLIILTSYGIYKIYQYNTWKQTTGEVVQLQAEEIKTFTGDIHNEIPVIRYIVNDYMYEIRATLLTGFNDLWAGDQVTLIYPEYDPAEARVLNLLGFWLPIPSIIVMMLVFLVSIGIVRILSS